MRVGASVYYEKKLLKNNQKITFYFYNLIKKRVDMKKSLNETKENLLIKLNKQYKEAADEKVADKIIELVEADYENKPIMTHTSSSIGFAMSGAFVGFGVWVAFFVMPSVLGLQQFKEDDFLWATVFVSVCAIAFYVIREREPNLFDTYIAIKAKRV